jgi:hypothetical protein
MKIHLHSRQGLFTVATYGRDSITVHTKHKMFGVPITDFKCFAGGGWAEADDEEQKLFLSVVAPHLLEQTLETEAKIKALASLIDLQEKAKESAQAFVDQYSSRILQQLDEEDDDDNDFYSSQYSEPTAKQYEEWWRKESDRHIETKNKLESIARKIYSKPLDMQQFQVPDGIKFIIQQNHEDNSYRFCWDPYGFVDNGHSAISNIYRHNEFHTVNGGWIKVIEKDVILYYKSGDYGVYDDTVAIECAKKLFPDFKIHSYAGREWDKELDRMFMDLPF